MVPRSLPCCTGIARIRSHELPYGISTVASSAVEASLLAHADLLQRVETGVAERDRLYGELRQLGLSIPRSHANFLWLASDAHQAPAADEEGGGMFPPSPVAMTFRAPPGAR